MDKEKYRSADWQENKLKELYYAFGTSEEEGLKLFSNLVFELLYSNPSFLEKLYNTIDEIKQEAIYDITEKTLDWVGFWKSYNKWNLEKNLVQLKKLKELRDKNYLSSENLGRLFFELGFNQYALRKYQSAAKSYEQSIRLLPDWSWSYYNLGIAYSDLSRRNEAIASYQKAIVLDPKDAYPYYGLGYIYHDLDRKDEAIVLYQKAIEIDPKCVYPYIGLGKVYDAMGRSEEAIASYQKAIDLDPNDAYSHNGLGYVYCNLGRYDEAIVAYQKAIELDPKDAYSYNGLGYVYWELGHKKEALEAYQKAIELDPKSVDPYSGLGYLHLIEGNLKEAKIYLAKAISIDANDDCALINLGITLFQLRKRKKAQDIFSSALEKCPLSTIYGCINKITALLGLGQSENALEILHQTQKQFSIQPAEQEAFFKDWNLLAASPEPPAGINEFIEKAKEILSK